MGYRIDYGSQGQSRGKSDSVGSPFGIMTAAWFLIFLLAVGFFWEDGRLFLQRILIPGEPEVTLTAMETLARDLASGASLRTAAGAFCTTILEYGTVY